MSEMVRRVALGASALVAGLGIAACGSSIVQTAPRHRTVTTVIATPGAISAAFNINADCSSRSAWFKRNVTLISEHIPDRMMYPLHHGKCREEHASQS